MIYPHALKARLSTSYDMLIYIFTTLYGIKSLETADETSIFVVLSTKKAVSGSDITDLLRNKVNMWNTEPSGGIHF
jgi:hypothetical protein